MLKKIIIFGIIVPFFLGLTAIWISTDSIRKSTLSAEKGNASAQNKLGDSYSKIANLGILKGIYQEKALTWYEKSAAQNNPLAQASLGEHYYNGIAVPKNIVTALDLYKKAALQGHTSTALKLAKIYHDGGQNIVKDYKEALKWYKLASTQTGDAENEKRMGDIYIEGGHGIVANYELAAKSYWNAAQKEASRCSGCFSKALC